MTDTFENFTVSEKVLIAAMDLEKKGKSPFTAEDLIVSAWMHYPRTFGLKGYLDKYPDSNKVLTSIMGERGLARRGWLVKMGQKLYAITNEGRRMVSRLLNEDEGETPQGNLIKLARDKEKFLRDLLGSSAYRKFEENQKNDLAFADACRFWDITQNLKGDAVDQRLQHVEEMLNDLDRDLANADAELRTGRVVTAGDLRALRNIHRYMEDRFERLLNLLRSRTTRQ